MKHSCCQFPFTEWLPSRSPGNEHDVGAHALLALTGFLREGVLVPPPLAVQRLCGVQKGGAQGSGESPPVCDPRLMNDSSLCWKNTDGHALWCVSSASPLFLKTGKHCLPESAAVDTSVRCACSGGRCCHATDSVSD